MHTCDYIYAYLGLSSISSSTSLQSTPNSPISTSAADRDRGFPALKHPGSADRSSSRPLPNVPLTRQQLLHINERKFSENISIIIINFIIKVYIPILLNTRSSSSSSSSNETEFEMEKKEGKVNGSEGSESGGLYDVAEEGMKVLAMKCQKKPWSVRRLSYKHAFTFIHLSLSLSSSIFPSFYCLYNMVY